VNRDKEKEEKCCADSKEIELYFTERKVRRGESLM